MVCDFYPRKPHGRIFVAPREDGYSVGTRSTGRYSFPPRILPGIDPEDRKALRRSRESPAREKNIGDEVNGVYESVNGRTYFMSLKATSYPSSVLGTLGREQRAETVRAMLGAISNIQSYLLLRRHGRPNPRSVRKRRKTELENVSWTPLVWPFVVFVTVLKFTRDDSSIL